MSHLKYYAVSSLTVVRSSEFGERESNVLDTTTTKKKKKEGKLDLLHLAWELPSKTRY
jgi:hypothetical protein